MFVRIQYELQGVAFEWEADKADANVQKHGVSFHAACEVFFDPFVRIVDTSNPTESREAAIGYTEGERLLFVVHVIRKKPSASSPRAKRPVRIAANTRTRELIMRRLRKNRAMSSVTLRMPEDVVEDLKRVAPTLGFAGYQPLIRAYIGKGLRIDLARLDEGSVPRLIASLKRKGVADSLIQQALAETDQAT